MKTKRFIAIGLLAALAIALVVTAVVANRKPERRVVLVKEQRNSLVTPSAPALPVPAPNVEIHEAQIRPTSQALKLEVPHFEPLQTNSVQTGLVRAPKPRKSKPPIQDPAARVALSFVGADPDAEEYWYAAINDSTLSAHERKDLIEDLNEDGLSNPKHPGPQDLPLIWSRIQLIEALAPFAMDEVNADAFAEAYKDLVNLAGGQPAQ